MQKKDGIITMVGENGWRREENGGEGMERGEEGLESGR